METAPEKALSFSGFLFLVDQTEGLFQFGKELVQALDPGVERVALALQLRAFVFQRVQLRHAGIQLLAVLAARLLDIVRDVLPVKAAERRAEAFVFSHVNPSRFNGICIIPRVL